MGTRDELERLVQLLQRDRRPAASIDAELPLTEARDGFARMAEGDVVGKIVFTRS